MDIETKAAALGKALAEAYESVIAARGGELSVERNGLVVTDVEDGLVVLHAEGYRHYSRRFGDWYARLSYLAGQDDNGPWAVRVPGTITTVSAALRWLTPARVRHAQEKGRKVARQGDVYAVQVGNGQDRTAQSATSLGGSHRWDPEARILHHEPGDGRPHGPLHVPYAAIFVRQSVYRMYRSGRRGSAD